MIYAFKRGVVCPVKAQVVGEALEQIHVAHNGWLVPEDVVEAARPAEHPLHPAFEWNDKAAADKWRIDQASYLIRSVVVVTESEEGKSSVRAFVSVERADVLSYTTTAHAMSDVELRAQVLARALRELQSWRDRYDDLVELAMLFAQVDETVTRLKPKP